MGEEDSSEDVMMAGAIVYQPPFGRLVGGLMGLIAIGLYQLYAAYETKFRGELKLGEMNDTEEKLVTLAGRTRTVARALAIGAAGAFVVLATYRSIRPNPGPRGGARSPPESALRLLHARNRGCRISLVYRVFMLLVAYYKRIDATSTGSASIPPLSDTACAHHAPFALLAVLDDSRRRLASVIPLTLGLPLPTAVCGVDRVEQRRKLGNEYYQLV
jgi:hypothetical protein